MVHFEGEVGSSLIPQTLTVSDATSTGLYLAEVC